MTVGGAAPGAAPETLARVVAAARTCFRQRGVRRTRMSDVAAEAGVVRQTLYDWVSNRVELVDLALAERTRELGEIIRARVVDRTLPLEEQLAVVLTDMLILASGDEEFDHLARALPEEHVFAFMAGPSPLTDVVEDLLGPYFRQAAEAGILRDGLGVRPIAEWVQMALAPLTARSDLGPDVLAERIRHFLVPVILERRAG